MDREKFNRLQRTIDQFRNDLMSVLAEGEAPPNFGDVSEEYLCKAIKGNIAWLERRQPREHYGDALTGGPSISREAMKRALEEARRRARHPWVAFSDRHPGREDGDAAGFVAVRCGTTVLTERVRIGFFKYASRMEGAYAWAPIHAVIKLRG